MNVVSTCGTSFLVVEGVTFLPFSSGYESWQPLNCLYSMCCSFCALGCWSWLVLVKFQQQSNDHVLFASFGSALHGLKGPRVWHCFLDNCKAGELLGIKANCKLNINHFEIHYSSSKDLRQFGRTERLRIFTLKKLELGRRTNLYSLLLENLNVHYLISISKFSSAKK